ncbi:TadE/TadG family protein [Thalassovita sp.]|uniref:TadE/TadG family type IV pilus assembly protein n=1 Tax=Thalassovita sp. TaxID=1979401 RepID=UPI002AB107A3|nr:TadE/TadG family protein [Thalassovita sp.]
MTRSKRLHMASRVMQGPTALRRGLHRFGRDESGAVVIFSIFMFICMLMVGGVGIDLMRFERDRMALQNTLDRAVLAAADLDQTQPAEEVVRDYFDKAGVGAYLQSVTVDEGIGYRSVSAKATSELDTYFLKLFDIDTMSAPASGQAEERIDGIEISLVLDVSGSMGSNQRLTRLRPAAKSFVDTVLASAQEGNVYISVVPYATQVGVGQNLLSKYNVTNEHSYSHCVDFGDSDFNTTEILPTDPLQRSGHFDPWYNYENPYLTVCSTNPDTQILPFSNDQNALHDYIDDLEALGATSIDVGMKWGAALLDPGTQPVLSQMISEGSVSGDFEGRPHAYNERTTLKVVVLMTDGENTTQYFLNDGFREGLSPVWYNSSRSVSGGRYSVQQGSNFWWPHTQTWEDHAYGNGTYEECEWRRRNGRWRWTCWDENESGTAVQLTYPELWNRLSVNWNMNNNMGFDSYRYYNWYDDVTDSAGSNTKDARTDAICTAAKDQGIVIFTVGFEAPDRGQNVLRACASSDSHHFDVDGLAIDDAFASIAASIRKLRLVQ